MPGECLLHGDDLWLSGCLLHATSEAWSHLRLLVYSLHLLAVLRHDGLLALEILCSEVLAQITVCEDGVAAVGLVEGFEDEPATDEAVGIRLCGLGIGSHWCEVLGTVLELYPVYADRCIALNGDHQVCHTLRRECQRGGIREPLVAEVTTEHRRSAGRRLGLHGHINLGNDFTGSTLLTDRERGVLGGLGGNHQIAISEAAEIDVIILQPAFSGNRGLITAEGVDGIDERISHTLAGAAVTVNLNLLGSLVDTYAAQGGLHLLDGAVGIEIEFLDADRTALVVAGREPVAVIEQIPLTFVVDDAVVVSPAAVVVLGHDQALVLVGTHRVLTHGVAEHFGILTDVWIGEVVVAVILEGKRSFSLTVGQVLETVHTHHLELSLTPLYFLLWSVVGQFLHVGLEFGTASCTPEDVGVAVRCLKHTGVDAVNALDRLRLRDERSLRSVCDSHADTKAAHGSLGGRGEVEIVLAVALNAVGCPHRIGVRAHPGYFVLGDDHTVVCPVGEILG